MSARRNALQDGGTPREIRNIFFGQTLATGAVSVGLGLWPEPFLSSLGWASVDPLLCRWMALVCLCFSAVCLGMCRSDPRRVYALTAGACMVLCLGTVVVMMAVPKRHSIAELVPLEAEAQAGGKEATPRLVHTDGPTANNLVVLFLSLLLVVSWAFAMGFGKQVEEYRRLRGRAMRSAYVEDYTRGAGTESGDDEDYADADGLAGDGWQERPPRRKEIGLGAIARKVPLCCKGICRGAMFVAVSVLDYFIDEPQGSTTTSSTNIAGRTEGVDPFLLFAGGERRVARAKQR